MHNNKKRRFTDLLSQQPPASTTPTVKGSHDTMILNNNNNTDDSHNIGTNVITTTLHFQSPSSKRFKSSVVHVTERAEPQSLTQKFLVPTSPSLSSPSPSISTTISNGGENEKLLLQQQNENQTQQFQHVDGVVNNDGINDGINAGDNNNNNNNGGGDDDDDDDCAEFNVEEMADEECNVEELLDNDDNNFSLIDEQQQLMNYDTASIEHFVHLFQLPEECITIFKSRNIVKLYDWQQTVLRKMINGGRGGRGDSSSSRSSNDESGHSRHLNQPTENDNPDMHEKSLLYSLSTSAGKTLVSEFLLLHTCQVKRRNAMLILPYVSIVEEKRASLDLFAEFLNFYVESYYANRGTWPVPALRDGEPTFVFIATIEKANTIINELLESDRMHELGCIVVDELHMIGDERSMANQLATKSRGILLESCLSKVNYWNRYKSTLAHTVDHAGEVNHRHPVQIVGMSATIPNLKVLADDWLSAELYQSDFRPVPLQEYYVIGSRVFDSQNDVVRDLSKPEPIARDRDFCIKLCSEIIPEYSCIVFCPTKRMCEQTVSHIGSLLPRNVLQQLRDYRTEDKSRLIADLEVVWGGQEQSTNRQLLTRFIPYGIVFHHSGLMSEERLLIEKAFQDRTLCIICATSTLAAGVNLPARRVIFRTPKIAGELLTVGRYKQMAGRAGRAGIDAYGESFMIITGGDKEEQKSAIELLHKNLDNCVSQSFICNEFDPDNYTELDENVNSVARFLLEVFCSGLCSSLAEVKSLARCTLFWHVNASQNEPLQSRYLKAFDSACQFLIQNKIIEDRKDSSQSSNKDTLTSTSTSPGTKAEYGITPLGMAIYKSSFSLEEATFISSQLTRAQEEGIILSDELHVCFLLTPVGDSVLIGPNWSSYLGVYNKLTPIRQKISKMIDLQDSVLFDRAYNRGAKDNKSVEEVTRELVAKRFYNALILCDIINEEPLTEVAQKYGVYNSGDIQTLMTQSSMFSNMMRTFCSHLSWTCLDAIMKQFTDRIAYGVKPELVELVQISGVNVSLARLLYNSGVRTQLDLAQRTWQELLELVQQNLSDTTTVGVGDARSNNDQLRELIGLLTTEPEKCCQGIIRDVRQVLNKKATQLRRLADECDQQPDDAYDDHSDVEDGVIIDEDSFDGNVQHGNNDDY